MKDTPMKTSFFRRQPPVVKMVALSMFAGLLIWAKLRLVTDFPRTVKADPAELEVHEPETEAGSASSGGLEQLRPPESRGEPSPHDSSD